MQLCPKFFALLSDLPVGNLRVQIGLTLRHAWLINGILFNSEAWHNVTKNQVAQFVDIDKYLLRGLVGAHAKVPLEHLYLEMAALPVTYVLAVRRMIYLHTILKRNTDELTKKVYLCQKSSPLPGDWCQLVTEDFRNIDLHMTDENIEKMHISEYKKIIKERAHDAAFKELQVMKEGHSKVSDNVYKDFKNIQPYFKNKNISNR